MVDVNFVVYNDLPVEPGERMAELERLSKLTWQDGGREAVKHMWIWPVYSLLRGRLASVTISDRLVEGVVNVALGEGLRVLRTFDPRKHFVVSIRADFRPFPYANLEVVQNKSSARLDAVFVPHLPHPGLKPRCVNRADVHTVGYFGKPDNLWRSPRDVAELLSSVGLRLVLKEPKDWGDYSDIDLSLGVRTLDRRRHNNKPATKLFNAWLAGVPFVGGNDSAFSQCGLDGSDYIRVMSETELLSALETLRNDSALYNRLAIHGRKRAELFTESATAEIWKSLFQNVIFPRFDAWRHSGPFARTARHAKRVEIAALEHPPLLWLEKARFVFSRI